MDSTDILYEAPSSEPRLVAGPYAKEFAALWLRLRGRRFGSYKKRKDAGVVRTTGKIGTFKKQRLLQKGALHSQSEQRGLWLRGASTRRIAKIKAGLLTELVPPGKKLQDFIDTTKARLKEKEEVGLWRGFPLRPSAMRRNKPLPQALAPPQGPDTPGIQPAAELQPVIAISESVGFDKRQKYRQMTRSALISANAFIVESVSDLALGNSSPTKLVVWFHAIAKGRRVVEERNPERTRQFLPSIESVAAKLHFTAVFREKESRFFQLFTSLLEEGQGKYWKSVSTLEKGAFKIERAEDVRLFLLSVQRVPQGCLSFSSACKRPRRV